MIRPNRAYQFVTATTLAPKASDFSNAETLSSVDDILTANSRIGEYMPEQNADLDAKCHEIAERVEIKLKTLETSGNTVNDSYIVRKDGTKVSIRLYGTERKTVEPRVLDREALKNLHFHFCKSDGKRVSNFGTNAKGVPCQIPVIYLGLA